jgi:hypothetical protein
VSDYQYVPVPVERLTEIHSLLASPSPSGDEQTATTSDGANFWTVETNIKTHLKKRSRTIRRFLKYLADRPGKPVSSVEVAEALELKRGWNSLAGANGAFAFYLQNRDLDLPWDWEYAGDNRVRFTMDPAVAAAIRKYL